MLTKNKRGKEVPKILLKCLRAGDGNAIYTHSPLYMLLIEAYAKQNMKQEAADTLRLLLPQPELPDWDAEVIRAEQSLCLTPIYYVPNSLPPRVAPSATVVYRNGGDPFGAYAAATKAISGKATASRATSLEICHSF